MRYCFETIDVFSAKRFRGNPLAVFPDAAGLDDDTMQALAAEMNLSETTFVLPAENPRNTARVRIFNRRNEMPFAGHPMIGTAFALERLGRIGGKVARFEIPAGLARVQIETDMGGGLSGGSVQAPKPFSRGLEIPVATVASCLGLEAVLINTTVHSPVVATTGNPYLLVQVNRSALAKAVPDLTAFQHAVNEQPELSGRLSIFVYAREDNNVFARMFAPLAGTWEDPATGSASTPLAGLLLQSDGVTETQFNIHQGHEMGRPSLLRASAWRTDKGIQTSVAGACVSMFSGSFEL